MKYLAMVALVYAGTMMVAWGVSEILNICDRNVDEEAAILRARVVLSDHSSTWEDMP